MSMDTTIKAVPPKAMTPGPLPPSNTPVKGPRDAQLIHLILANNGVHQYQERVALQLMDFAYRYTSSTLQDALHFSAEGQVPVGSSSAGGRGAAAAATAGDMSAVSLATLRLSIGSRSHYQHHPRLPKQFYQGLAQERNRIALPSLGKEYGVRLPPEQFCLTGVGWDLKEEWDEEVLEDDKPLGPLVGGEDVLGEDSGGEEGDERMEDIFGEDIGTMDENEDKDMQDA